LQAIVQSVMQTDRTTHKHLHSLSLHPSSLAMLPIC